MWNFVGKSWFWSFICCCICRFKGNLLITKSEPTILVYMIVKWRDTIRHSIINTSYLSFISHTNLKTAIKYKKFSLHTDTCHYQPLRHYLTIFVYIHIIINNLRLNFIYLLIYRTKFVSLYKRDTTSRSHLNFFLRKSCLNFVFCNITKNYYTWVTALYEEVQC